METIEAEAAEQAEAAREQRAQSLAEAQEREVAADRLELTEARRERLRQKEVSKDGTGSSVPVMDMRFCISHLDSIRMDAGDFTLKDFSDYWAPDNKKTTPNRPNTFVPNRITRYGRHFTTGVKPH